MYSTAVWLLLLLSGSLMSVAQDYEVHLTVHSITNTGSSCVTCYNSTNHPTCCDNDSTNVCNKSDVCDLYLSFCRASVFNYSSPCPLASRTDTTDIKFNARSVLINQSESTILGLRKPLIVASGQLLIPTQLDIRLFDRDFGNDADDLVDVFVINVTGASLPLTTYSGVYGLATIVLSYNVVCVGDCNRTNCEPGYTGLDCETALDPCSHGNINCSEGGECVNGSCVCAPRFTGSRCEIDMDECTCNNNGHCQDSSCVCDSGYSGLQCEEVVNDPCVMGDDNCNNNGVCTSEGASESFSCVCDAGYTGEMCQITLCQDTNCRDPHSTDMFAALVTGSTVGVAVLVLTVIVLMIAVACLVKSMQQAKPGKDETGHTKEQSMTDIENDVPLQALTNGSDSTEGYAQIGPVYASLESEQEKEERYREALNTAHKYDCLDGRDKYEYVHKR